jgi:hypothetical protein
MPACPNGAQPKPGYTGTNLVLDASKTALADVVGVMTGFWGELAVQPLLGRVNTDNLCALNLTDPGPPTSDDLVALTAMLAPFGSFQTTTNIPNWFFEQVQYQAFVDACECISPVETIPPRQTVTAPPGAEPWPTDPNKQPQNERIERYLQSGADGQTLLYQGLQLAVTHASDLWQWQTPSTAQPHFSTVNITMQGEGYFKFPVFSSGANSYTDVAGIITHIDQLPLKYKARGTLNPRYYGVGSVYWDCRYQDTELMRTSQRESIHYQRQAIAAPRHWQTVGLSWYLQPGAIVTAQHVIRDPRMPTGTWVQPHHDAYGSFGGVNIPDDVTDPPLWPPAAARGRQFALGGVP